MPSFQYRPYVTRLGCLVERVVVHLPNGAVHEHVTLSTPDVRPPRSGRK